MLDESSPKLGKQEKGGTIIFGEKQLDETTYLG
jgi:hypothetical protein